MYKLLAVYLNRALPSPDSLPPEPDSGDKASRTDQAIFSALYDRYAPVLLGVIATIVTDKAKALLVLEDTFSAIHAQINQFKPGKQPLFTWLLCIARHTAIDALHKSRQPSPADLELSETGKVIQLIESVNVSPKTSAGSQVPADTQQKVFLDAVLFKNCTPEEAALSAGIPAEQAQPQLRLAVQQLRQKTDGQGPA